MVLLEIDNAIIFLRSQTVAKEEICCVEQEARVGYLQCACN